MAYQQLIGTSSVPTQINPGELFIQNAYQRMPKQWEKMFKEIKVYKRNWVETSSNVMPTRALQRQEGKATTMGSMSFLGKKRFYMKSFGIAIGITYEILADNLYEENGPQYLEALVQSQLETANIEAANVLNNAANPNNGVGWDGKPLLATDHPIEGGTLTNRIAIPAPIQENTLFQMLTQMFYFRAPNGNVMTSIAPEILEAAPTAVRQLRVLLDSQFRPGTASFEINPAQGAVLKGFNINRYLKPNAYFLRTSNKGLWFFNRENFRVAEDPNPSIWAVLISSMMRYLFDFDDFRAVLGGESAVTGNT